MSYFNLLLKKIAEDISNSAGSVEIIRTVGSKVLSEFDANNHWVEFGASNLDEIRSCAEEIKALLLDYENYDDVETQFMPDVMALMDDLAYHGSIYNLYYISSIRYVLPEKEHFEEGRYFELNESFSAMFAIRDIAYSWNVNIPLEKKTEYVQELTKIVCIISEIYNRLDEFFTNGGSFSPSSVLSMMLGDLHYAVLNCILIWKRIIELA